MTLLTAAYFKVPQAYLGLIQSGLINQPWMKIILETTFCCTFHFWYNYQPK